MKNVTKITINTDVTLDATALTAAECAQLLITLSKCEVLTSTYEKVGDDWVDARYTKPIQVSMSREAYELHASYDAAKDHLKALAAAAQPQLEAA